MTTESLEAWSKRTRKPVWEHPDWWGRKRLVCRSCQRTTYRPALSKRPCDCGGTLTIAEARKRGIPVEVHTP